MTTGRFWPCRRRERKCLSYKRLFMQNAYFGLHLPWTQWIALAVEFQARPSVIPPLWRDDRCALKSVEQADLDGNHSYKFIYSGFFTDVLDGRKLLILLVGAGRFERPTPCAQGRCATRLRYAPTVRVPVFPS